MEVAVAGPGYDGVGHLLCGGGCPDETGTQPADGNGVVWYEAYREAYAVGSSCYRVRLCEDDVYHQPTVGRVFAIGY